MRRVGCIWLWFGIMASLARLVTLVTLVVVTTSAEETTATNYRQELQSDYDPNRVYGVASVAGITSRNGRISSTGGVHFYTPDGVSSAGDGYYNPLTYTKAIDGKYASGSVQIYPGALGVSSSAQAGYIDPGFAWPMDNPWPRQWQQWPDQSQFYASFGNPWLNKVKLEPPRDVSRRWMYPSFNPFLNFWR